MESYEVSERLGNLMDVSIPKIKKEKQDGFRWKSVENPYML